MLAHCKQGLLALHGDVKGGGGAPAQRAEQRVRSDASDKALNALRQLVDEIYAGRFPGLFLVITGTPACYDGPQGVQRLAPLAQRLATHFDADPRWDNPRAPSCGCPVSLSTRWSSLAYGDVTAAQRRAILAERPDILLTTPESLESMLVSTNVDHRQFFAAVRAVATGCW